MEHNTSSAPGRSTQSTTPVPKEGEKTVHIIFVQEEVILNELHQTSLGNGPIPAATLSQVAKHIGQPAPTDIIVFAKRPWHFAGRAGHSKELRAHPQVHRDFPETVLVLGKNEQAVYWSERNFQVTDVQPSDDPSHRNDSFPEADSAAPRYPFEGQNPMVTQPPSQDDARQFFTARSGKPKPEAAGHMYKITFDIENQSIDPDVYCGSGN